MHLVARAFFLVGVLLPSTVVADGVPAFLAEGGEGTILRFEEERWQQLAGREDRSSSRTVLVSVAGDAVREDRGVTSFLFRPDLGRLYRLDHELRIYQEYRVPTRLQDHLPAHVVHLVRTRMTADLTGVERLEGEGGEECGLSLEGNVGDRSYVLRADFCPRSAAAPPVAPYLGYLRNLLALSPLYADPAVRRLADEGRFPIRMEVSLWRDGSRRTEERRFLSAEPRQWDPAAARRLFEVPEGYAPGPPWCLDEITVGSDPECRRINRLD